MAFFKKNRKQDNNSQVIVDDKLKHIAFIMDGNGRWATKRKLPRQYGHTVGAKVFKEISTYCGDIGIKYVTVYAFSTENWKRPKEEVDALIKLLKEYLFEALDTMMEKDVQIHFLGDISKFDDEFIELMNKTERESKDNNRILNIALNYGSMDEICHAANVAIATGKNVITPDDITANLYTKHCPPPDLIVRTGGEYRLSNFLLWQAAYSELYFTPKLWPDMTTDDVDEAVRDFYNRNRRFGGI